MNWLKRGGRSLGDPSKNPWCGDFVETCIRIGLPDEQLFGALEWAFRVEKAQLELPVRKDMSEEGFGFGLEYVLLQRATLGCKVDGGQHKMGSYAEVVAATVAGMPDSLGGIRMAFSVAELARAGITPDWMPGVVPHCVPVETKSNQHGERAIIVVVGTERVLARGKCRTVEVLACPVTWPAAPRTDCISPTRLRGLVAGIRWVAGGRDVARCRGDSRHAESAAMENQVTASKRADNDRSRLYSCVAGGPNSNAPPENRLGQGACRPIHPPCNNAILQAKLPSDDNWRRPLGIGVCHHDRLPG
jgi:hypothetical protein